MSEMWKGGALCWGMCYPPSGKLKALDATGRAEEGCYLKTHDNELSSGDFFVVPRHNVNESMLLAVNPIATYHVVGSVNGVNIKFMLDTGVSVSLISKHTWDKLAEQTKPLTK